ncbi:hypothetical protein D3C79_827130 [compost metagenome]
MRTGAFQNVMRRLVISHQVKVQLFSQYFGQWHEAYERMQVVRFAIDLLDPPLQLTAQSVTCQHCRAVAMGHPPKYLVQQVPAVLATVAGGLFQLAQQRRWHLGAKRTGAFRQRGRYGQQICHRPLQPGDLRRVDAMPQQHPGLVTPGGEQAVAVERDHPHKPICTGACGSRKRALSRPLRSSAWAGR